MRLALVWLMWLWWPCSLANAATIVDAQGVKHQTGYLGLQHSLTKHYWTPAKTLEALPAAYDSRAAGFVAPVRQQGNCGSCWDFSMTKTFESARLVAGKKYLDLAEQDLLVNDTSGSQGCEGGYMNADYLVQHGEALETACPYAANDQVACSAPPADRALGWGFVGAAGRAPTLAELKAAIYQYKVISVTVAAGGGDWQRGGVMKSCHYRGVNHMVNLVGWRADGTFIGRNSWGTSWGDKGDFYAPQGCDQLASTPDSAMWISYK